MLSDSGVDFQYLDFSHLSCRLHLTLNLILPLCNLHIPLLIFLKVFLGPSNNLLYRSILFQKVEFRDSGLDGLMMFLVQLCLCFSRVYGG
jgi:hypothetical protein